MVTNLQFAGVAAYLLWCLFSALTGVVESDVTDATARMSESDENTAVG